MVLGCRYPGILQENRNPPEPGVNSANDVTAAHLAAIATLEASNKSISALKAGDFDGLTALTTLDLSRNTISDISLLGSLTALTALELSHNAITDISVLKKLTKLRWLFLSHNAISDISPLKNLTALKHLWLGGNAIKDISALEKLTKLKKLWLSRNAISDISVLEKLTPLTALWLDGNAISDVSALEGLISLVSLNLSGNPISDYGPLRRLKTANPDITIDIDIDENDNNAPVFTAGSSTTRSVAENTASGTNIGTAITATDADTGDTLTYTLGGTDAASFSIVSTSGQLRTSAALDRETKASYSVTVTASDGSLSDTITVTINVTNVNEAPTFATTTATRSVAENTATNQNIGAALTATDVDSGTTLTYSIPTTGDAAAFSIVSNTGQLKTKNALNHETKASYTVVVTASDGTLSDTITVTISVTNVNEAPAFATGTTISNISATQGTAITSVTLPAATDPDANTTLTYTVTPALPAGLTFTASTRVLSGTPTAVSASATYTYTASDSNLSATLTFTIQVRAPGNNPPTFTDGTSTPRTVSNRTGSYTETLKTSKTSSVA